MGRRGSQANGYFSLSVGQKEVYVLYADYVMKNPFYEIDMPIKCDQWEAFLRTAVDRHNRANSTT